MKHLLAFFLFNAISQTAFAHPGGNTLVCHSAKQSGSSQKIELSFSRSNGPGWYEPDLEMNIGGNKFKLTTPDEMSLYGATFHDSPLKVISDSAEVPYDDNTNNGFVNVVAIPNTVKAFDSGNKPVKWSMKKEKEECYDTNGRATFQGIIQGHVYVDKKEINVEAQILDCELTYDSGMSC
jgi:hypothetical protein